MVGECVRFLFTSCEGSLNERVSAAQTAEYGFGAPEIYFGAVLGAPKVHYVIILDSFACPNPPIRFFLTRLKTKEHDLKPVLP